MKFFRHRHCSLRKRSYFSRRRFSTRRKKEEKSCYFATDLWLCEWWSQLFFQSITISTLKVHFVCWNRSSFIFAGNERLFKSSCSPANNLTLTNLNFFRFMFFIFWLSWAGQLNWIEGIKNMLLFVEENQNQNVFVNLFYHNKSCQGVVDM